MTNSIKNTKVSLTDAMTTRATVAELEAYLDSQTGFISTGFALAKLDFLRNGVAFETLKGTGFFTAGVLADEVLINATAKQFPRFSKGYGKVSKFGRVVGGIGLVVTALSATNDMNRIIKARRNKA